MKRAKGDQLTGGTGDVNPQILTIIANQLATDTPIVIQQPLPIPRYPTKSGYNLVVELLAVDYYDINPTVLGAGGQTQNLITVTTNPQLPSSIAAAIQDPRLIDAWLNYMAFGPTPDVGQVPSENYQDLTDKAGHGILVAADNLYIGVFSAGNSAAKNAIVKLWYRWKAVTLTEYIGIVQSQQ